MSPVVGADTPSRMSVTRLPHSHRPSSSTSQAIPVSSRPAPEERSRSAMSVAAVLAPACAAERDGDRGDAREDQAGHGLLGAGAASRASTEPKWAVAPPPACTGATGEAGAVTAGEAAGSATVTVPLARSACPSQSISTG